MSELWQHFENLFLREVGMKMPRSEIAEKLECSEPAITCQASRIGTPPIRKMTGRSWTVAEFHLFGRFSEEEIAKVAGRTIYLVRSRRDVLIRSGGLTMRERLTEELAILMHYTNAEVSEITGRSIKEVRDERLQVNIERNGWDVRNPEREDS